MFVTALATLTSAPSASHVTSDVMRQSPVVMATSRDPVQHSLTTNDVTAHQRLANEAVCLYSFIYFSWKYNKHAIADDVSMKNKSNISSVVNSTVCCQDKQPVASMMTSSTKMADSSRDVSTLNGHSTTTG